MKLTREEICAEFEAEWVLIDAPETGESLNLVGRTVLHHSKDRDEVYRRATSLRPPQAAILFTGSLPEGTAIVL